MTTKKQRKLWNDFEDMVLALTVLNLRREGYTYTSAFKVASGHINRTAKACSSRWYRKTKNITEYILQSHPQSSKVVPMKPKKAKVS